jgi:adenylate cyclase
VPLPYETLAAKAIASWCNPLRNALYYRGVRKAAAGMLVGLGAAAIVFAAADLPFNTFSRWTGASLLQTVELKSYDWRLVRTAHPSTARKDIALVEIDEYSLRNLQPNAGRWPWPRAVHSMLIDYLARAPAKVVAYDVVFSEPDMRTGFDFGGSSLSGAESDKMLADSIKAAGNVIVPGDASYDTDTPGVTIPDAGYPLDVPGIYELRGILPPFPLLANTVSGLGHNRFILDPDGPLRHMVPFVRTHHRALPSLGAAAALRMAGIRPADVRLDGMVLRFGDHVMPLSRRDVKSDEGTTSYLWSLINFRGSALLDDLKGRLYPTYRFFDLLYSEQQILENMKPNIDPVTFRDKAVFVGVTAAGLFDVFETPFSKGKMPGINIHAAVTDDILSNRFLRPESESVTLALVLLMALAVGLIATETPPWWATAITATIVAGFAELATRAFAGGYWLNLSQPTLAASFALFGGVGYQYFVEGREKRKMKQLFGQYVSRDVYQQLVSNPALARLGGQRREMTVLFSDIRNFTMASEREEPEDIVRMLNEYFTRMVDIVFKHKGTLDKFVGDMVMALFGAPLDDAHHGEHAVDAALEMIDELHRLNEHWAAEGRPALDIGIGINTGPMIAGNIGSEAIMSYTVIGDSVNLGSRLESLNKNYGTRIIISDATRAALPDRYIFRPLGEVVVKGKIQPVAIFEVVGRAPLPRDAASAPAAKEASV